MDHGGPPSPCFVDVPVGGSPPHIPREPRNQKKQKTTNGTHVPSLVPDSLIPNMHDPSSSTSEELPPISPESAPMPLANALPNDLILRGTGKYATAIDAFSVDEVCVIEPPICVICDDGGDLVYCEGPCKKDGEISECRTLTCGYEVIKDMKGFYCMNCFLHMHQCTICGKLGYIEKKDNKRKDIFQCGRKDCHALIHFSCFKKTLEPQVQLGWSERVKRNPSSFVCNRHHCIVCKEEGDDFTHLVQCRRCPKAWHITCMPDQPYFMVPDRGFVWKYAYCSSHPILEKYQTPSRRHVDLWPKHDDSNDEDE